MLCPKCSGTKIGVIDSRAVDASVKRRRECGECGFRFTTFERVELQLPSVIKKNGRKEPYSSEKILKGFMRAFEKRDITMSEIDTLVRSFEAELHDFMQKTGSKEVSSAVLGETALRLIAGVDQIAYIRFASVYKEFSSLDDFYNILKSIE